MLSVDSFMHEKSLVFMKWGFVLGRIYILATAFSVCTVLFLVDILAFDLTVIRSNVVKIRSSSRSPNAQEPWRHRYLQLSSGSGVYIGDGLVLTNAHVVTHSHYLSVQRDGDDILHEARVKFIAHDCDLAVLKLVKQIQWPKTVLKFGKIPKLSSPVVVVGYPIGGDQISFTKGVVSRISSQLYVHDKGSSHILIQVDSAINAGNSGGPVLQNGRVIGIAFQGMNVQNIAYIIPVPVIKRFLEDIEDGQYNGFPIKTFDYVPWTLMNPAKAEYYGLEKGDSGVEISYVFPMYQSVTPLIQGDIILSIDEHPVGFDGKTGFFDERIDFLAWHDLKKQGKFSRLTVVRNRKKQNIILPVIRKVRGHVTKKTYPSQYGYLSYGGLVFMQMSYHYLESWGKDWYTKAPPMLRYVYKMYPFDKELKNRKNIVILTKILRDQSNQDAPAFEGNVLMGVNDQRIESLSELKQYLFSTKEIFVAFRFFHQTRPIILNRKTSLAKTGVIAKKYLVEPQEHIR